MNLKIDNYSFGARPDVTRPDAGFLQHIGEVGLRNLVSRHYDLLRQSAIAHLFPTDDKEFEAAKVRSSDFMIQICGGPDYFNQNRGRPMLINRHSPFAIDASAREIWLDCYKTAILEIDAPEHLIMSFWNYIQVFSVWMLNKND
jgi:hemoglobin